MTDVLVQVNQANRRRLSPSALGSFMTCGRKGQYYLDPDIPRTSTIGLSTGSAYHHALEQYYRLRQAGDDTVDEMYQQDLFERAYAIGAGYLLEQTEQPDFTWLPDQDQEAELAKAKTAMAKMLRVWAETPSIRWDTANVIGVEAKVEADFESPHHYFMGIIDTIVEAPGVDGPILVDHKTAGRAWGGTKKEGDPRKLLQAPLYAEAWLQQTGVEPGGFAYDVMTHAGKFQRIFVDVRPETREPFLARWYETSEMIAMFDGAPMPTNPESNLCSPKYCSYWDICPMGSQLGR